jgi:hypothetical protein
MIAFYSLLSPQFKAIRHTRAHKAAASELRQTFERNSIPTGTPLPPTQLKVTQKTPALTWRFNYV